MPGTLVGELLEEAVGLEDRAGDPEYVAYVDTDRTTVAKHLNLPLESNSVGPDAPLNIYTTLQLPMQEEWNSLLQQVAETSNVSNEEIEGTLMVILKIEILSGVEYYTEHRLSEPMRYLNQGVKTIPFAR